MSVELYWQHAPSSPGLSSALMGFHSITMKTQSGMKTELGNPLRILIRSAAF